MVRKYGMIGGLLLVGVLLLGIPNTSSAALFGKSVFSDVDDAMRAADNARDKYDHNRSGRDADRYERKWRDSEEKLEEVRVKRMAKEGKIPPREVQRMREDGRSWRDVSDRYRVDARKMGCGQNGPRGYDRDNDRDLHRYLYKKGRR